MTPLRPGHRARRDSVRRLAPAAAAVMLAAGQPLAAQVVVGTVLEETGDNHVGGALIELLNEQGQSRASSATRLQDGTFRIAAPAAGRYRLRVSRIGFESAATDLFDLVRGDSLVRNVRLRLAPLALDTMRIAARDPMTGFAKVMRRQLTGRGIYIPGAIISIADPHYLTQYLNYLLGGVFAGPNGRGLQIPEARCTMIFVNDWPRPVPASALDRLVVRDIAAIEIYRTFRDVPEELQLDVYPCGLINIWTTGAW